MLEFQHLPINITGIDTKTDDKNSIPGTFVVAENVYMQKSGKIENRAGFKFPDTPVTHNSEVIAAIAYGDSNLAIERDGDYFFDESKGQTITSTSTAQKIATIDYSTAISPVSANSPHDTAQLPFKGYSQSVGDTDGLAVWTVLTSGTTYKYYYSKYRINSKIITRSGTGTFTSAVYHNPICLGNSYIVRLASVTQLAISNILAVELIRSLTTTGGNITRFDANESPLYIAAVHTSNAVTTTKLSLFTKLSTLESTVTLSAAKTYNTLSVSINPAQTEIYVACGMSTGGANNVDIYVYNIDLTLLYSYSTTYSALTVTQYQVIENTANTSQLIGFFVNEAASPSYTDCKLITKSTGAIVATKDILYNHIIVSHANYPYMITRNDSDVLNCCYFLIDISGTNLRVVSTFYYGQAIPYKTLYGTHELVHFSSTYLPMVKINPLSSLNATNQIYSLFFNYIGYNITTNLPYIVNWNGSLITNAWGNLRILDNTFSTFPIFASWPISAPLMIVGTDATPGGLTAGVYNYLAIFTAYDNNNNAIYSSPLYAVAHTCPGAALPSASITFRNTSGFVEPRGNVALYRTEVDGSVFYFVQNLSTNPTIDGLSDANLILNRALYTTGDIVDSAPAPTAKFIAIAKSRLWIISAENDDQAFFSKRVYPGEAPQFNSIYSLLVQNIGGKLQAVAEMDDKVIIFRENAIFVIYGDGPDEIGNGAFSEPQVITISLGCKYPRSIVLNDKGLFFMSYEGIYIVTRGLTVEYVGAAVENFNTLTITQALNLVDRHQLWFNSAEGTTLMHDDFYNRWYTFTTQKTYASFILNDGTPAHYTALAASKYPGRLMIEDSSLFYDGAVDNPIAITLETGWISLAGIQGFQRMRTLTWLGNLNNTITLSLYHDFEAALNESFTVLPATVGTTPAQYQVKPIRQRCQALKYKITMASLTGVMDISSMAIEAGLKKGTIRYDRSKRVSS